MIFKIINQSKCRVVKPRPDGFIPQNNSCISGSWNVVEEEAENLLEPEDQGVCCKTMSPNNDRRCTHRVLPTWLPKHELNMDNNIFARVDRGKPVRPQHYPKNYGQLRNSVSGRKSSPRKSEHTN